MRQVMYISVSTVKGDGADLALLQQSRYNNGIDGITGLLWSDGSHFMQVFEGPEESVGGTWSRIQADTRHSAIGVMRDTSVSSREFGDWSMAHHRAGDGADMYDKQVHRLLRGASPEVSEPFWEMISGTH